MRTKIPERIEIRCDICNELVESTKLYASLSYHYDVRDWVGSRFPYQINLELCENCTIAFTKRIESAINELKDTCALSQNYKKEKNNAK